MLTVLKAGAESVLVGLAVREEKFSNAMSIDSEPCPPLLRQSRLATM